MSSSTSATGWLELAEMLLDRRQLQQSHIAYHRAESAGADPDRCGSGRWHIAMLSGDFEAAWRESDAIRARGAPDPNRFWKGESLSRASVIVRCLHGFGDAVQMLRYAPLLQEITSRVSYEVPPRLFDLAPLFRGVREVISWGTHTPEAQPYWDVQVEVTELPYIFRTSIGDLPVATRYMNLPSVHIHRAATAIGISKPGSKARRLKVGYVWAAGEWNPSRSIPFAQFETLLGENSVEHWSLQGGVAAKNAQQRISAGKMRDATAVCGDGLVALATAIAKLDLVITVDTLAAHLAGAIGKPVWTLLQYAADWRWMTQRTDSPWYPEMRLFRQPAPGDWRTTLEAVQDAMARHELRERTG